MHRLSDGFEYFLSVEYFSFHQEREENRYQQEELLMKQGEL